MTKPARSHRLVPAVSVALALIAGVLPATASGVTDPAIAEPAVAGGTLDTVAAMQPSWNLGNTLDAIPDETSWGNPLADKALFDTLRSQGFHSVRIPVTWGGHQSTTAAYPIDQPFLTRVKQVVDWALADDLSVVLNLHHDSWQWIADMPANHDVVRARFDATWTQIASTFKDTSSKLLFESVNEPSFTNATDNRKTELINELNTSFHSIVRASGGENTTRLLVLPTLGSAPDAAAMDNLAGTMASLNDPALVATVHFYGFWPFSVNIAGYTRFDSATQQDMINAFTLMRTKFVAKGIPVYLGEYGLLSYPDYTKPASVERGEALKYFEMLGEQARTNGVTTALWDAGSFINRNTLQWRDPVLIDTVKSSWDTRSGTASSDSLFVPKSGALPARTLTLNLNGTTFQELRQGGTSLVPGRDYTVAGDQLTLTAPALTRLAGDRTYGVNATLQASFSQGVPWQIDVITYDPPAVSNASGTIGSFALPTEFHGDRLATMEAKYGDGGNAGPADWTSYQEFNASFSPNYEAGTIALTRGFLDTLKEGVPVTLTFHFWSGGTAKYSVTRSGESVTGTTSGS